MDVEGGSVYNMWCLVTEAGCRQRPQRKNSNACRNCLWSSKGIVSPRSPWCAFALSVEAAQARRPRWGGLRVNHHAMMNLRRMAWISGHVRMKQIWEWIRQKLARGRSGRTLCTWLLWRTSMQANWGFGDPYSKLSYLIIVIYWDILRYFES